VGQIKGPRVPKKVQFTQERVEYNVFLFDDTLKGSKSLKIFKINLTFRFVTFIKIRSHRRKFSNSDSVEQKINFFVPKDSNYFIFKRSKIALFCISRETLKWLFCGTLQIQGVKMSPSCRPRHSLGFQSLGLAQKDSLLLLMI
jgi:hypothetical protein